MNMPTRQIRSMRPAAINRVRELEAAALALPQVAICTHHVLHAGVYARTICIPAGVALTGAEIKLATLLIIHGRVRVGTDDDEPIELDGYNVIPASAGRKQAFLALTDTHLTMIFPTRAITVAQAEDEFTDEAARLFSRIGANTIQITGE